ncbi:hypothetical protein ACP3TJ_06835 [Desulforudis sp. 1088]|uniref:hypothetical protein n=1 Tax=unclassified Candidatus Desulforudis TaxID=2635950 RepID=UPI00346EB1DD
MLRTSPLTAWQDQPALPLVSSEAYVDEAAVLIGAVTVNKGAIICPGAVLRADEGYPIIIGENTNVQDGVIMHALMNTSIEIGSNCSIAHGAIVHGPCFIGTGSFIGFRAVVFKTSIGHGCFVGHGAMVMGVDLPDNVYVPPGRIIATEADVERLQPVPDALKEFMHEVLAVNAELLRGYRQQSSEGGSYAVRESG